jgi:hypothetical protein
MDIINRWSDSIDAPCNIPIYSGNSSEELWVTRDHQLIRVGDMTDLHVKNCYDMVRNTESKLWQQIFKKELEIRGILNNERNKTTLP